MNKLIVIGWIGGKHCYLNVTREEAERRYKEKYNSALMPVTTVDEIEFEDEFEAYDVWGSERKVIQGVG